MKETEPDVMTLELVVSDLVPYILSCCDFREIDRGHTWVRESRGEYYEAKELGYDFALTDQRYLYRGLSRFVRHRPRPQTTISLIDRNDRESMLRYLLDSDPVEVTRGRGDSPDWNYGPMTSEEEQKLLGVITFLVNKGLE